MKDKVIEFIAKIKGDESLIESIRGSEHLTDELGLDSLQLINLVLLVESEFDLEVDFELLGIEHLTSLDRFCGFIEQLATANA